MNQSAVLALGKKLAEAVKTRQAIISHGEPLTGFNVMSLDKQAGVLAADLLAAWEEQQTFAPWSPFNAGNAK